MHSIHVYTCSDDPIKNAFAPRSAERSIEICASLIDLARIENNIPSTVSRQTICFDEWNVWDSKRAPGNKGAEELYTMSDALAVAVWLNVFVRQSRYVSMANIAQSVNVISPLMTNENGLVKQSTWWPLLLFSKYMRGWTIATHVSCSVYRGETQPQWIQSTLDTPWLDISATVDEKGWVNVAVVNLHLTESFDIDPDGFEDARDEVEVHNVTAESWDAVNTVEEEKIEIREGTWKRINGRIRFPHMSITMLRWKVKAKA